MVGNQRNVSIDEKQVAYIREHYGQMPTQTIATNCGISLGKLRINITLLDIRFRRNKQEAKIKVCNGMYNEADYLLTLEVP